MTVVCTYLAATLLGHHGAVRAAATLATAALPQFTYISATVNPDSLAAALASIGLVLLLRLVIEPKPSARTAIAFGAVTGSAVLAEYHGVYLLLLAALAYVFVRPRGVRQLLRDGALAGGACVVVVAWWFGLNIARYGEPTGLLGFAPEFPRTLLDPYFVFFFPTITYQSLFGAFGWLNAYLPAAIYATYGLLWLAALWGICRGVIVTRTWTAGQRLLVLAPLLILALVLYRNLSFNAPQGRYFFPALVALSLLFACGLAELPRPVGRWALAAASAFLVAANLYALAFVAASFTPS